MEAITWKIDSIVWPEPDSRDVSVSVHATQACPEFPDRWMGQKFWVWIPATHLDLRGIEREVYARLRRDLAGLTDSPPAGA